VNDFSQVPSPCVKVCVLDERGRQCIGCWRTLDEIGLWSQMSNPERAAVVGQLPERRRQAEAQGGASWIGSACSRCGAKFKCGARDTMHPCWCVAYPSVKPEPGAASCMCPGCLATATAR
jgi:predicted Fe-S protein YdhL (DUF1289 family)